MVAIEGSYYGTIVLSSEYIMFYSNGKETPVTSKHKFGLHVIN